MEKNRGRAGFVARDSELTLEYAVDTAPIYIFISVYKTSWKVYMQRSDLYRFVFWKYYSSGSLETS